LRHLTQKERANNAEASQNRSISNSDSNSKKYIMANSSDEWEKALSKMVVLQTWEDYAFRTPCVKSSE
jgi:hypothetical protein